MAGNGHANEQHQTQTDTMEQLELAQQVLEKAKEHVEEAQSVLQDTKEALQQQSNSTTTK